MEIPSFPGCYAFDDPALRGAFTRPAVSVGVFDGVHRGHQALLKTLVDWAGDDPPVVITFHTHPRRVLGQEEPDLITSLAHRVLLLQRAGAAGVVVLPFDTGMANWSPQEFVQRVFVDALGAGKVLVGANHRFGKDRAGDVTLLRELGQDQGFEVREAALERDAGVISSTAIRERLAAGDLEGAAHLLGRPVSALGRVVQGDQRGRTIGFPTANLDLRRAVRPPRGVYAARARRIHDDGTTGQDWLAAVNIGRRPTFHPEADRDLVEVHLLDAQVELYGALLEVEFVAKLRDERSFDGVDALKAQIGADVAQVRSLLG